MSRRKGDIAEDIAVEYLRKHRFEIIDRNISSRFGEIDVIAKKFNVLHFVEVKSAKTYELAMQNITPKKLQRFLRTVDIYLKKHRLEMDYCIDAIAVTPEQIYLVENITI